MAGQEKDEKMTLGTIVFVSIVFSITFLFLWSLIFLTFYFYLSKVMIFGVSKIDTSNQTRNMIYEKYLNTKKIYYNMSIPSKISLKMQKVKNVKEVNIPKNIIFIDVDKEKGLDYGLSSDYIYKYTYRIYLLFFLGISGYSFYRYTVLKDNFYIKFKKRPYGMETPYPLEIMKPLTKTSINNIIVNNFHLPPYIENKNLELYSEISYEASKLLINNFDNGKSIKNKNFELYKNLRDLKYKDFLLREGLVSSTIKELKDLKGDSLIKNDDDFKKIYHFVRKTIGIPYSKFYTAEDIPLEYKSYLNAILKNCELSSSQDDYLKIMTYSVLEDYHNQTVYLNKINLSLNDEDIIKYKDNNFAKNEEIEIKNKKINISMEELKKLNKNIKNFRSYNFIENSRFICPEYYILTPKPYIAFPDSLDENYLQSDIKKYLRSFKTKGIQIILDLIIYDLVENAINGVYKDINIAKDIIKEEMSKEEQYREYKNIQNAEMLIAQKRVILENIKDNGIVQSIVKIIKNHNFEETIVFALLIYTKTIINIGLNNFSGLKEENIVLWNACATIGRPNYIVAGLPILFAYRIEKEEYEQEDGYLEDDEQSIL